MIHRGKHAEKDTTHCIMAIRKNCAECMQGVLSAMTTFDISLGLAENAPRMQVMDFSDSIMRPCVSVWADFVCVCCVHLCPLLFSCFVFLC